MKKGTAAISLTAAHVIRRKTIAEIGQMAEPVLARLKNTSALTRGGARMDGGDSPTEKAIKEVSLELGKIATGIKQQAEATKAELARLGTLSGESKDAVDKMLKTHSDIGDRIAALEKNMSTFKPGGDDRPKSVGQMAIDYEDAKRFMAAPPPKGSVRIPIKLDISSDAGSAGVLVQPDRRPGIIAPPERTDLLARDLVLPGTTSSNSIEFVKEEGFTNLAAPVSEGETKPQSTITFEDAAVFVRTIAHWIRANKQILADAPQLRSYIDSRLRYGLRLVENNEILMGDGTGQHLLGIYPQATAYTAPLTIADETGIDRIRLAMLQVFLAEFPAAWTVMHPIDWTRIELSKDDLGRYIIGNPQQPATPTLWGKPVLSTQSIPEGDFLVGSREGAQVFDREDASVVLSTEDQDNFVRNKVTILAEERLALAVYRPESYIKGQFDPS